MTGPGDYSMARRSLSLRVSQARNLPRRSGRLCLRLDPLAAPYDDRNQLGVRKAAEDPRLLAPHPPGPTTATRSAALTFMTPA